MTRTTLLSPWCRVALLPRRPPDPLPRPAGHSRHGCHHRRSSTDDSNGDSDSDADSDTVDCGHPTASGSTKTADRATADCAIRLDNISAQIRSLFADMSKDMDKDELSIKKLS